MPVFFESKVLSLTHSCSGITELVQQDNMTVSEALQHFNGSSGYLRAAEQRLKAAL